VIAWLTRTKIATITALNVSLQNKKRELSMQFSSRVRNPNTVGKAGGVSQAGVGDEDLLFW
jgi:hypothetical protein